jgi:hypothetical protein
MNLEQDLLDGFKLLFFFLDQNKRKISATTKERKKETKDISC